MKDGNYITIQGWMRTRLELTIEEAVVYAIIYGFSQDRQSVFDGGIKYITGWTGKSDDTIIRILQSLTERGLIVAEKRPGKSTLFRCTLPANCDYPQNAATRKNQGTTPLNLRQVVPANCGDININNNKEKESGVTRTRETQTTTTSSSLKFEEWWQAYGMTGYESQKEQCLKMWNTMTDEQRAKAMKHTKVFAKKNLAKDADKRKQPFYYLVIDKIWMDDVSTMTNGKPKIYTNLQAYEAYNNGAKLCICKLRDGYFPIVELEEAKEKNLEIIRLYKI